jgi:hypothetical protein
MPIVLYKRSWHDIFSTTRFMKAVKKEKRTKKERKGRPVETAAAVEIDKDAFGDIFLMISTAAWKSLRGGTAPAFPQLPQARRPSTNQREF